MKIECCESSSGYNILIGCEIRFVDFLPDKIEQSTVNYEKCLCYAVIMMFETKVKLMSTYYHNIFKIRCIIPCSCRRIIHGGNF